MVKVSLYLIIIGVLSCSKHVDKQQQFETIPLAEGDLIFRKGIGTKTQAVLCVDSSGVYSHAGIVVLSDSVFKVVHITPGERKKGEDVDQIKLETLNEFWADDRAENGAVYRLKDNSCGKEAARHALRLLQKGILFDHDYLLSDSTEMYCTELVWYVYQQAGRDITEGKRSVLNAALYSGVYILPSDIYTNKGFRLIYNF